MPLLRALLALLLFVMAGCSEPVKIPLEIASNDVAIVAARIDGRLNVKLERSAAGEPLSVDADSDEPIYTWVLKADDFVLPSGEAITPDTLAAIVARLDGAPSDPGGATGSCGRCLAPSSDTPQVVNDGDSCRLPPFVSGAVWQPTDSGYVCSGAIDSPICSTGPEADQKLIEEVRRAVFLDWPGACACSGEQEAPSLSGIEIRAVSPINEPNPISAYAQDDDGRIAGFSRDRAILWDPVAGTSSVREISGWPVTVRYAIALRDGSGFLVASEEFNTGYYDAYRFDRFTLSEGALIGPEEIASDHISRPERMEYLGDHPDLPLYLIGYLRGNLGSFEPAVFACTDRTLACQQVGLAQCDDERDLSSVIDIEILPDGSGFALANNAFYYKEPNLPPIPNPHPADTWACSQNESRSWEIRGGGTVKTRGFDSLGRAGNRIFVCGTSETAACTPDYAVVLSATVTSSAGAIVDPEWEVVYRGYDWSRCRDFMRVPGNPSQARLRISGLVLVDFDQTGAVVKESDVGTEYGTVEGVARIDDLALDGWTLLESNESQAFVKAPSSADLQQFYGGPGRSFASYRSAVAIGEGDFLVFGNPSGIVRVRVLESGGDFPNTEVSVLADPTAALQPGDDLRDGVLDTKESAAAGMPVVMIVGERGGSALLMRTVIGDSSIVRNTILSPPKSVDDLGAVRVGEASPGQFVIGLEGTRLLRSVGDEVTELAIDFDDRETDAVEARPVLGPDQCNGNTPRLDAWRDIAGKNGVAWVIGSHQLLFRVTGDRVERFMGSPTAEYSAMLLECADRAVFAGRGVSVDLAGLEQTQLQFWSIDPVEPEPGEEISLVPRREQALRELGSDQVVAIGIGYIVDGYPRAVLPDSTGGRGADHAPFAVPLHNGVMPRFYAAEGLEPERPPFWPEVVVGSPGGYVLYGGWDSRLAIGVPQAKR